MIRQQQLYEKLAHGEADRRLGEIYGSDIPDLEDKRARLLRLTDAFGERFGKTRSVGLFSGPGRTEMGGNHTDHQHGRVLAGAVEWDTVACAGPNQKDFVCIHSEGYPAIKVNLNSLTPKPEEKETSTALVRGIAARLTEMGYPIGGFDAVVESAVLSGSGLSSSAAFETLTGTILNHLFCTDTLTPVQIAQVGQYAENVYFGKPCGLMDQLASAVGGIAAIDFADPKEPVITKLHYDLEAAGYALCIIDSGADHADLTDEYAAIPREMAEIASFFGKKVLRDVDENHFWKHIAELRAAAGDRAVLRAIHFFEDNMLAFQKTQALERDDIRFFLALVNRSGLSSEIHLQNLSCASTPRQQALKIAITAAKRLLDGEGAVRVHGGGFAGTAQAYVPIARKEKFRQGMEAMLGKGCCHFLRIRPVGSTVIL